MIQGENLFSTSREFFERPEDFAIKNSHRVHELLISLPYWTEQSILTSPGNKQPQGMERLARQLLGGLFLNEALLLESGHHGSQNLYLPDLKIRWGFKNKSLE